MSPAVRLARELMALAKPGVSLLVLITTLGGIWLAPGPISLLALLVATGGTILMVAAANTLNCYLERESDKLMRRTADRPLPAGRLAPGIALAYGLLLAAFAFPALALGVNLTTGLLGLLALVSYVALYTPLKKVTPAALLVGAVPGAMPPLMGWSAVTAGTEWGGLALFDLLYLWQLPHFLAIAIYRGEEYTRAGIRTLPAVRGVPVAKRHAVFWSVVLMAASLVLVPMDVAGRLYGALALTLGTGFVALAVAGLRASAGAQWARSFFLYTLLYLTILFGALVVDGGPWRG